MPPCTRQESYGPSLGPYFQAFLASLALVLSPFVCSGADPSFINFETAPVHPIALSPGRKTLAVCNLPDGRLELFNITSGQPVSTGAVPVGIDPVSVRFRTETEAWVVNHISDSISIVDVGAQRVKATIQTLDTPSDVVFAGTPLRAYVSCSLPNTVQVIDPADYSVVTNILIDAERPKALDVSPDGERVYAAIFESGNQTTIVGARFQTLLFIDNVVSLTNGPYAGANPPPNNGNAFTPPINPSLPSNSAPASGIIVRKNQNGRWLDDNSADWTEFVSGTNAHLTQRVPGWDLPDRDLAIINTADSSVSYRSGLMNICMSVGVNPVSGAIAVIGTDADNHVRFEPNVKGTFLKVKFALVDAIGGAPSIRDLNPHLDYLTRTLPDVERSKSIGDPRAIIWNNAGTQAYVAGMGSGNLLVLDAQGNRTASLDVGPGPCGLALDESRQRLYIYNRFSSSIATVDTVGLAVLSARDLFDPSPTAVAAGRLHLYETRRTSGLGQAACASCHVDGRMDRLAWDLGNPAGETERVLVNHQGVNATNNFHPMKGVMVTQTLQDIIGHEPFHWRGDKADIEAFNPAFSNLQGAPEQLSASSMREFRDFLSSIRFPPNPFRSFNNSLPTNMPLPGHTALGQNVLPSGTPLPNGNAIAGLNSFNSAGNFCATCHTLPTGLGLDSTKIAPGTNGGHHLALATRLEGALRSKIAQFRNLADRIGMDGTRPESRAGFGYGHDGSVDSLTRFMNGVRVVPDQDVANLIAFLLSVAGADVSSTNAPPDPTPPAGVGKQLTLGSSTAPPLLNEMVGLASAAGSRIDLIVKGHKDGVARGWVFARGSGNFQSDRQAETASLPELLALAAPGNELTFMCVLRGTGQRLGIDRDNDGILDGDELPGNPSDRTLLPRVLSNRSDVAAQMPISLEAQLPPLSAPATVVWRKDGQVLSAETNRWLNIAATQFGDAGQYTVVATTIFGSYTSAPVRIVVHPLLVSISPLGQNIHRGSAALFSATSESAGTVTYQWEFNGQVIQGATNELLNLAAVELKDEGDYRVRAANAFGSVTSAPARLQVLINPSPVLQPVSQRVVVGDTVTFDFAISGHPPPFGYYFRRSSTLLSNYNSADPFGAFTLSNVQPANAGTYRITATNLANPGGLTLDPVTLTVLADTDGDGLPDEWEAIHGLGTNNPADAEQDSDGDSHTNRQEYRAGTNPKDKDSYLKILKITSSSGASASVLQFMAASNKTYTVEYANTPNALQWLTAGEFFAHRTNRTVTATNYLDGETIRYYRLRTPRR